MTAVALAAWLVGLALFVGPSALVHVVIAPRAPGPAEPHNVAFFRYGTEVRASSYHKEVGGQHHPLWLIDGRNDASLREKWASDRSDPSPWVELRWPAPRLLSNVVVVHAGKHEDDAYTVRDYTITCLRDMGPMAAVTVRGNRDKIARHPFACAEARGVRLEIDHHRPGAMARIYEIEAIGQ